MVSRISEPSTVSYDVLTCMTPKKKKLIATGMSCWYLVSKWIIIPIKVGWIRPVSRWNNPPYKRSLRSLPAGHPSIHAINKVHQNPCCFWSCLRVNSSRRGSVFSCHKLTWHGGAGKQEMNHFPKGKLLIAGRVHRPPWNRASSPWITLCSHSFRVSGRF